MKANLEGIAVWWDENWSTVCLFLVLVVLAAVFCFVGAKAGEQSDRSNRCLVEGYPSARIVGEVIYCIKRQDCNDIGFVKK